MSCSARIDDQPVGEGGAFKLTGGIVGPCSFCWSWLPGADCHCEQVT